jgi:hypothetical protein
MLRDGDDAVASHMATLGSLPIKPGLAADTLVTRGYADDFNS